MVDRVVDPDPHPDPDLHGSRSRRAKITRKNRKKVKNFLVPKC
jgi:hypothetical protein